MILFLFLYLISLLIDLILIDIYLKIKYEKCLLGYVVAEYVKYTTLSIIPIINTLLSPYLTFIIIREIIRRFKCRR